MPDSRSISKNKRTNVRLIPFLITRAGLRLLGQLAPGLAARWAAELFLTPRRHRRPTREEELLSKGSRFSIEWRGKRLAVWSWGRGPLVLLVHGWEGRGAQLGSFVGPLVEAGYRAVAFDGPGHGASEGNRSSLVELADAVKTLGESLGEISAVIAHSMGAAATTMAIRWGLKVERLIYVAPPAELAAYARRFAHLLGISTEIREQMESDIEERLKFKWSALNGPAIAPTMETSLLVFHDIEDRDVPWRDGKALVQAWPGARLITTSGLGHRHILHNKGVVSQAVTFIKDPSQVRESSAEADGPPQARLCARQGCNNPIAGEWDRTGRFCSACAFEMELYDPQARLF
jgi:pimeloyl-ACP methyl ester carboxylesterase